MTTPRFDPDVSEALRHYVYLLVDPRNPRKVFYVGKGQGDRVFTHVRQLCERMAAEAASGVSGPRSKKQKQIERLLCDGCGVEHVILRHGLTEAEAMAVEAAVIDLLRHTGFRITNAVRGVDAIDRGIATIAELNNRYGPVRPARIDRACVLFRLNEFDPNWSSTELYNRVRGWWRVPKDRRMEARYAAAVYQGVVRQVFSLEAKHWDRRWERRDEDMKWAFVGRPISEGHRARAWVRTDVREYFLDYQGRTNRWQNVAYVGFREVVN